MQYWLLILAIPKFPRLIITSKVEHFSVCLQIFIVKMFIIFVQLHRHYESILNFHIKKFWDM